MPYCFRCWYLSDGGCRSYAVSPLHLWIENERGTCCCLRSQSYRDENRGLWCIGFGLRGRDGRGADLFSCVRVWGEVGLVEAVGRR